MLIDIVLDAVGSDKAPEPEVRGAIRACRELPVRVHLIGPEPELRDLLEVIGFVSADPTVPAGKAAASIGSPAKAETPAARS